MLIALEFTSLVPFLAEGGTTPVTIPHSRYPVYFAAYGICALIMALDLKSAKRFLEKPLVRWAFAALMLFTWGMLVRMFNAPAGIEDYLFFRMFGLQVNAIGFLLCCTMIFDDPATLQITKRAVVVATLVGVVLNIYDFMFPGTFSYYPGRAAGLYVNPNVSGISLVFGCVIGLSAIRRRLVARGVRSGQFHWSAGDLFARVYPRVWMCRARREFGRPVVAAQTGGRRWHRGRSLCRLQYGQQPFERKDCEQRALVQIDLAVFVRRQRERPR